MKYDRIIEENEKLIWKIASHFYGVDKNDLFQAGVVGLLKATQKYQSDCNTKFSTFAHDYVFGEMYLLASNKSIKISKDILNLCKKIEQARYYLAQKMGKIPSNIELSNYLEIDLDTLENALMSANKIMSLDTDNEDARSAYESISVDDGNFDTKIIVDDSFEVLNDQEKSIIRSRYYEDLTQQEVARKLNITQVMVSRYEKRSLDKMRDYLSL